MSTFLQLCQALRRESTDSGTGPSTVVGQSGELARMVNWIINAWVELQQDRDDWQWMRHGFTVNTAAGDGVYAYTDCTDTTVSPSAAISRFARWYEGSDDNGWPYLQSYRQSDGVGSGFPLIWLPWDAFRRLYRIGTQNNAQPLHVSADPQQNLVIGPTPDDIYVVSGDYQIGPQVLAQDVDEPEMPSRFHMLICYEALAKYGGNRIAPEAMVRAISEGGRLRQALEQNQLPRISFGSALA